MSWRRPPTFMPGMPSCHPLIRFPSGKVDRLSPAPRRVELLTGVELDAEVVHLHRGTGSRLGAVADRDVGDDERRQGLRHPGKSTSGLSVMGFLPMLARGQ